MPPNFSRTIRRLPTRARRPVRRRVVRRIKRKPTYRRRTTTRRRYTGSTAMSTATFLGKRRMDVMRNPFSLATTNPKIPDNRTTYSAGQRLQVSGQVIQGNLPEMYIFVYPGVCAGLQFHSGTATSTDIDYPGMEVFPYNNHVSFLGDNASTNPTLHERQVEKWRCVSQGLRLSLVNNTEENDGWFEYIRIPVDVSPTDWAFVKRPANPLIGTDREFIPILSQTGLKAAGNNMVDHVTYQSGKLRDIHKFAFVLHSAGEDHEFRNIGIGYPDVLDAAADDLKAGGTPFGIKSTSSSNLLIRDALDTSYGCILIKIHGNKGDATSSGTKLMYHMVSNQELIYDQASNLSRFHTRAMGV